MFLRELHKFAVFIISYSIDHKAKQASHLMISSYHPAKALRRTKYLLYLLARRLVGGFGGLGTRVWLRRLLLEEDLPSHLESLREEERSRSNNK